MKCSMTKVEDGGEEGSGMSKRSPGSMEHQNVAKRLRERVVPGFGKFRVETLVIQNEAIDQVAFVEREAEGPKLEWVLC